MNWWESYTRQLCRKIFQVFFLSVCLLLFFQAFSVLSGLVWHMKYEIRSKV